MLAEKGYDLVLDLFDHPEPSPAWVEEFNQAAIIIENRSDDEHDDNLPTQAHGLPWEARLHDGRLWVISPMIDMFGASFKLALDVEKPHPIEGDKHINAIVLSGTDDLASGKKACLITAPEAGPAMIFAAWDFVAREGVDAALSSGLITQSWIDAIMHHVPCKIITPPEIEHAMRMFDVYMKAHDISSAIEQHAKIAAQKTQGDWVAAHNKILFYKMLVSYEQTNRLATIDAAYLDEILLVKSMRDVKTHAQFCAWLARGAIDYSTIKKAREIAEATVYPNEDERALARDTRDMAPRTIMNARYAFKVIPGTIWDSEKQTEKLLSDISKATILKRLEGIISYHESMKHSWFWAGRCRNESDEYKIKIEISMLLVKKTRVETFDIDLSYKRSDSRANVYYRATFVVNGEKTTITRVRTIRDKIAAANSVRIICSTRV